MNGVSTFPEGWRVTHFEQIAESVTERVVNPSAAGVQAYVGLEHLDTDTLKISRWGSPADVESTKLRFYPGDVIYARRRAYQRKLGVAEFEGICSAHALVLRARSDVCLPEFLPFFLQSDQFHERALDISVGSLSPTINWKTLAIQEFALPPVAEQRLIVDVLKAHGEVVQSLEEVRSAAQTLYEAVGESVSRQAKKTEALADLLVHLIDHRGKTPKKLGTDFVSKGVPVVSAMNVFDDRVHLEGTKSIDADVWERWMPVKLERNDLLMTSEAPLGRTALVDSDQPLCLGQRLFALRFDPKRVEPSYAKAFFDARTGQASLLSRATGSTVLGIRASALRELHLPLLPLEEQRQLGLLAQKVLSIREQLHAELLAVRRLGTSIRRELLEVRSPNVR